MTEYFAFCEFSKKYQGIAFIPLDKLDKNIDGYIKCLEKLGNKIHFYDTVNNTTQQKHTSSTIDCQYNKTCIDNIESSHKIISYWSSLLSVIGSYNNHFIYPNRYLLYHLPKLYDDISQPSDLYDKILNLERFEIKPLEIKHRNLNGMNFVRSSKLSDINPSMPIKIKKCVIVSDLPFDTNNPP
jgi:hypothetical protein